ncbi:hypothetical protein ScPMuIL_013512 [Solemya velum]
MTDGGTTTDIPTIYAITPTYSRLEQKAELTRLSQTLMHVEHFHWIVVEDSNSKTALVTKLLFESRLNFTHLNNTTPTEFKKGAARGVPQRNAGLDWLRQTLHHGESRGVVYFMDDDNTYDIRIFEEMRYTRMVSVWPVGLVGGAMYESPHRQKRKSSNFYTVVTKTISSSVTSIDESILMSTTSALVDGRKMVRFQAGNTGHGEDKFTVTSLCKSPNH